MTARPLTTPEAAHLADTLASLQGSLPVSAAVAVFADVESRRVALARVAIRAAGRAHQYHEDARHSLTWRECVHVDCEAFRAELQEALNGHD